MQKKELKTVEEIEVLKKLITGIYLTGYDQGYHETNDDKTLEAFNVFWDSSNLNTWKEQLESFIKDLWQQAYSLGGAHKGEAKRQAYSQGRKDAANEIIEAAQPGLSTEDGYELAFQKVIQISKAKYLSDDTEGKDCRCHCHSDEDGRLAAQGIRCKCIKWCEHCKPSPGRKQV